MNIGQVLAHHARFRPAHPAFVFEGLEQTYDTFNRQVNRMANAMSGAGIRKGDKVAAVLPNCPELWMLYWAAAKIGAVAVPLSPLLRGEGLINLLNNADTCLLLTQSDSADHIQTLLPELRLRPGDIWLTDKAKHPLFGSLSRCMGQASENEPADPGIAPDDLFNIIYSSGTTGVPKGIMHSHQVRAMYMSLFANLYRMTPECVVLHSGSIIFNGAMLTLMPVMFLGGTFILHSKFDVDQLIADIRERRVTHTILVPSQLAAALQHPEFGGDNISSLEMILSVGAPLPLQHKEALQQRAPGIFYELYGLTEGFVTVLDKYDFLRKPGSVGCPPPFFDMRIVDEAGRDLPQGEVGEIVGRGPLLMNGYYKDPERTAQAIRDGWLFTGDMGYVDEDGFLFLVDRKKDLIISGGANVYPSDIEGIAARHPEVREVAVIGVPDERWGEAPVAAIVLKTGATTSPDELKAWINARVHARYQSVREVFFLDDFPRNVAGKTLKREIRARFLGG